MRAIALGVQLRMKILSTAVNNPCELTSQIIRQ